MTSFTLRAANDGCTTSTLESDTMGATGIRSLFGSSGILAESAGLIALLPLVLFDFYAGGAEDEPALRDNCAGFQRVRLLPKVLVDVSSVDKKTEIFGKAATLPLAIAPTGGISAGRAGAELILAHAAKAA